MTNTTMTLAELITQILDAENEAGDVGHFAHAGMYRRWRLNLEAHLT